MSSKKTTRSVLYRCSIYLPRYTVEIVMKRVRARGSSKVSRRDVQQSPQIVLQYFPKGHARSRRPGLGKKFIDHLSHHILYGSIHAFDDDDDDGRTQHHQSIIELEPY